MLPHLSFSLLCTKRTFFWLTSFQLKWPALSSWASFPFLESTSRPLVGVLTTWNRRSSTVPSWGWMFSREKSSGFIEPIARVKDPFTWRLGVCVLPRKHKFKGQTSLIRSYVFERNKRVLIHSFTEVLLGYYAAHTSFCSSDHHPGCRLEENTGIHWCDLGNWTTLT